uniref:exo-alpha-sialidase n=1 Tax=Loxodonta africana TaxID=9785 RepID=G3U4F9_LOXAF
AEMGAPHTPARSVLFQRERTGLTYRVPALLPVPSGPTLLAFAEQRLSPDDSHAHRLVLRRGTLAGGSVQWGSLHVLGTAALEEHRSMNPCPVHEARTGTVFLFFILWRICRTSPHAFVFYSDDLGQSWRHGGLVPNLRSGECQLAAVEGGPGGPVLYCNARSSLGSRVQALSADEGTSFLPGQLVPPLAETSRGCQGSVVGFPAPFPSWLWAGTQLVGAKSHPQPPSSGPRVQGSLKEASEAPTPSPTWLLYSHPTGRRARLHMGVRLSRAPLDLHSWTEPWVIHEGPSGYSDLAALPGRHMGGLAFACLYESGVRVSYEEISFCLFSLRDVLDNIPPRKQ